MLEELEIENYKSLHRVSFRVPQFGVLVGANAAGKSNFADAIEFLQLVAMAGLPSAVSDKGGYENLCFRRARRAKGAIRFRTRITGISLRFSEGNNKQRIKLNFDYSFSFRAKKQAISSEFVVASEEFSLTYESPRDNGKNRKGLTYRRSPEGVHLQVEGSKHPEVIPPERFLQSILGGDKRAFPEDDLILTKLLKPLPPFFFLTEYLSKFRVFQIMPSATRKAASASGSREMGKHGENLPAALSALQREDGKAYQGLLDQLRLAVPTVQKLETGYVETRELGLFLREEGMARRMFASELSDGTLRTIALFLPLTFPSYGLVVIEEPENCIHPWVVRQFVSACREMTEGRQIILTTHSPVLVSELKAEELFVVERRDGETRIVPASEAATGVDEIVNAGVMKLGQYWDSGAMGAVPEQLILPSVK
ncbi:MAG: AAA family ATPase [Candidatus Hydrogenedentes bacterium]|nr:AAA family ATPase [Candidatus Hydrogenedentota bacterium]